MSTLTLFGTRITAKRLSHVSHVDGLPVSVTEITVTLKDHGEMRITVHSNDRGEPLTVHELEPELIEQSKS